ncbi:MAG: ribonuclease HI family protein [Chloroflexota bacterium]|nr:ribonuclease HI family protein [Chloroflexota bacterium]
MSNLTPDTLSFDGSCDPNPGGRLGWGWQIVWADAHVSEGQGERPPNPAHTVNVGEYQGLLTGLEGYYHAGGRGPLTVQGDSQLVIYQMAGRYGVGKPHLRTLHAAAQARVTAIGGPVTFTWVRREHNRAADALAGGHPLDANPQRTILVDPATAPITPAVRTAITALNADPGPGFGAFARLRVGGCDALSDLRLPDLQARVPVAVGAQVQAAFEDQPTAQAAVLRWVLRGLALELAIRKGQVDGELRTKMPAQR